MAPGSPPDGAGQPVVVVTGGGGGIGAAVAEELGRGGWFVVTVDPLVSTDGTEQLPTPEETTAGRIVAAGGAARASAISVTDGEAVRGLFEGLVADLGRLDAVVNVAGISRPTSFTRGSEQDWRDVLTVHLDGYRNVLEAALPIMAAAGHGRILGVTSGSGWRQADTGAYGCAKRAVASLTWQLGRQAPAGVVVNAISPIAMTRMVTDALARAGGGAAAARPGGSTATGGLSLGSMPSAEELGPLAAHLVGDAFSSWCRGEVVFVGGSETAVIDPPRLLEVVRIDGAASSPHVLEAVTAGALVPAEAGQASGGGSNPRFASLFDEATVDLPPTEVRTCAIVSDRAGLVDALTDALDRRGVTTAFIGVGAGNPGFAAAAEALSTVAEELGGLDAVVVALAGPAPGLEGTAWQRTLAEHTHLVDQIHADAGWARAAADLSSATDRPLRLVTLTDATTAGGRSRAQAAAQLARAARRATGDRVSAFAVSLEADEPTSPATIAEVTAHLVGSEPAPALSGAELVVGPGWFGLRSHPRPRGSITFGGPELPAWLDDALRDVAGAPDPHPEELR